MCTCICVLTGLSLEQRNFNMVRYEQTSVIHDRSDIVTLYRWTQSRYLMWFVSVIQLLELFGVSTWLGRVL